MVITVTDVVISTHPLHDRFYEPDLDTRNLH